MKFELTEALIDELLFFMEDQHGEFYLDTVEGDVISEDGGPDFSRPDLDGDDDGEGGDRYISLPEWDSSSGYGLMERFSTKLRNPPARKELLSALDRGRGVFRAFKDVLGRYPEIEKLWFAFKEKEMRQEIIRWYNGLREEWGLEKIGMEPEETVDLVLEDFRFRPFEKTDLHTAGELHRLCQEEHKKYFEEKGIQNAAEILVRESQAFHYLSNNIFNELPALPLVAALTAETGDGEFAGFISGIVKDAVFYVQSLEVKPEYRGLGIGETLLAELLENLDAEEVNRVFIDLPSWAEDFSRVLLRASFKPYAERYSLDLRSGE